MPASSAKFVDAPAAFDQDPVPDSVPDDDEVTRISSAASRQHAAAVSSPLRTGAATSYIGRIIDGKYRIDEKIGVGGMGAVYRAARLQIGDEVAIKILHAEHVLEPGASERFRREAQAAARLKHPNAVIIHDFGVTSDELVYLVMEFIHGNSLRQIIKQRGPLKASDIVEILNQICGALDEAHRLQIVHRDLKPDNIIVKTTINGPVVKVLDFGIAKLRDLSANTLTQTGSVLGTPQYMSPEQCLDEEIDSRSDIYSLGIVLYEMLAGVVPFNSPTSTRVVVQQVNQPPPPLRYVNAKISEAIEAVVLQALAKNREARPQSARELAEAFSRAVNVVPVVSPSPEAGQFGGGSAGLKPTVVMTPTQRPDTGWTNVTQDGGRGGGNNVSTALIIVGALGLLAMGALAAILLGGTRGTTTANNAAPSPQPSINTSGAASPIPAASARESSTPILSQTAPTPAAPKPPPPSPSLPDQFYRQYQGTINGYPIRMTLSKSGGTLTGTATTYGSNSNTDDLRGPIDANGSFVLDATERGTGLKGAYIGRIENNGQISGYWISKEPGKSKRRYPFSVRE